MAKKQRPTSAQAIMPPRMVAEAIGGVGTEAPTTALGRRVAASAAVTKAHGPMPEGPGFPQAVPQTGDHMKLDHGKAPWHLAPWDAFLAIVHVLAFGAAKYRPNGWRDGMAYSRLFSATHRHLTAWWMREGRDPETGFSHLWHAATCVCFLISYELDAKLRAHDDRPILGVRTYHETGCELPPHDG